MKNQEKQTAVNRENPLVSVIMAVYNGERFLDEAINSVIQQTYPGWELLMVDDGSTDNSLERLKYWESQDPRVKIFRHKGGVNRGVSASRNLAIRHARGTYLAVLDCDDVWLPGKLAREIEIFREHPDVVFIYSKAEIIDENSLAVTGNHEYAGRFNNRPFDGSGTPGKLTEPFLKVMKQDISVNGSAVIFLKKAAGFYGNFNETTGDVEDTLLWYQLLEQGSLYFLDEVTARYRVHSASWNAVNREIKKLVPRRLKLYFYLIETVNPYHKPMVSYKAVDVGFRLIVRNFLIYPCPDWAFIARSLARIVKHKDILSRHKVLAVWVIIVEILKLPFRPLNVIKKKIGRTCAV
jgi:glycosyltransferase involved in cell wall biosynthesis